MSRYRCKRDKLKSTIFGTLICPPGTTPEPHVAENLVGFEAEVVPSFGSINLLFAVEHNSECDGTHYRIQIGGQQSFVALSRAMLKAAPRMARMALTKALAEDFARLHL